MKNTRRPRLKHPFIIHSSVKDANASLISCENFMSMAPNIFCSHPINAATVVHINTLLGLIWISKYLINRRAQHSHQQGICGRRHIRISHMNQTLALTQQRTFQHAAQRHKGLMTLGPRANQTKPISNNYLAAFWPGPGWTLDRPPSTWTPAPGWCRLRAALVRRWSLARCCPPSATPRMLPVGWGLWCSTPCSPCIRKKDKENVIQLPVGGGVFFVTGPSFRPSVRGEVRVPKSNAYLKSFRYTRHQRHILVLCNNEHKASRPARSIGRSDPDKRKTVGRNLQSLVH